MLSKCTYWTFYEPIHQCEVPQEIKNWQNGHIFGQIGLNWGFSKVSEKKQTYLSAMKLIKTALLLILIKTNNIWLWLDLSRVSLTPPEESNGPTLRPIWAKSTIFRISKKKMTYLSVRKLIQTVLFLILTNTNDVWLWLDLSKVSSTSPEVQGPFGCCGEVDKTVDKFNQSHTSFALVRKIIEPSVSISLQTSKTFSS